MSIHLTQFAKSKQQQGQANHLTRGNRLSPPHTQQEALPLKIVFLPLRVKKNAAVKLPSLARTRPSCEVLTRLSLIFFLIFFFILCPRLRAYIKAPPLLRAFR